MKKGKINYLLLANIAVLAGLGLTMVFSAGSYASQAAGESALEPLMGQLIPMVLGVGAMFVLAFFVDYHILRSPLIVYSVLFVALFLLGIVWIPGVGTNVNGSNRWLTIPGVGMSIQPGEIAKFAMVLYAAFHLSRKFKQEDFLKRIAPPILVICVLMFGLVMLQPNLSTAGCIVLITGGMLLMGGMKVKHVVVLGILGAAVGTFYAFSAEYRRDRLLAFSDPWGKSGDEAYQLIQSLYAIASGGWFGVGLGQSRQKLQFLPYCDSDFIFAIVCEELGIVGAAVVIALFVSLIYMGFLVALRCRDRFGSMLAGGISLVFAVQVVLHIAVVIGVFPTTGLPLPFFSSGGSNLVIFLAASGLLLNISRYSNPEMEAVTRAPDRPAPPLKRAVGDNVRVFPPGGRPGR